MFRRTKGHSSSPPTSSPYARLLLSFYSADFSCPARSSWISRIHERPCSVIPIEPHQGTKSSWIRRVSRLLGSLLLYSVSGSKPWSFSPFGLSKTSCALIFQWAGLFAYFLIRKPREGLQEANAGVGHGADPFIDGLCVSWPSALAKHAKIINLNR